MNTSDIDNFEVNTFLDNLNNTETPQQTQELEMNPEFVPPFNMAQESEEVNCDISNLQNMPELLAKAVAVIKKHYPWISTNSIINMVISKTAHMITAKRIKYLETYESGFPNYYSIIFMPSGFGKDKMSEDLDKYVFYPFRIWFNCTVQENKKELKRNIEQEAIKKYPEESQQKQRSWFIKERIKNQRNMILEVSDGTREGLYSDAKAFKEANFGSIFIKISELGQYLNNATTEQKLFLNVLFDAYSGKIVSKCIKGEYREDNIEDLPVNALMYSDPTLFKRELKKIFDTLMETGLGRRCVITFIDKREHYKINEDSELAYEQEKQYFNDLKHIGCRLYNIFESIKENKHYKITKETYKTVFFPYKVQIEERANNEENTLLQKEITSRVHKALKISCLYACINHPNEHFINPTDMQQAIETIEMLSNDFNKFLKYKPKYDDKYDSAFNFFKDNIGKEFAKNELITKYHQEFGYSRDKFRDNFDECMNMVSKIAIGKGYFLHKKPINRNSGVSYSLMALELRPLSDSIIPFNELLYAS